MPEWILFAIGCLVTSVVGWGLYEVGKLERQRAESEEAARSQRLRAHDGVGTDTRPLRLTRVA